MRTLLYIFAICLAVLLLFVTVDRVESNRPLATLLMILILGIVGAAVLIKVMPSPPPWRGACASIKFPQNLRRHTQPPPRASFGSRVGV
jgi:hypothetical protein